MPRLTISMLCVNRLELTRTCIESILRNTTDCELRILDNGSTDETPAYLNALVKHHPNVFAIREERNIGFIKGHNTLVAAALGQYVCVLNNDVEVGPGWDEALIAPLEQDPWIGATGPLDEYGCLSIEMVGVRNPEPWKPVEYLSGHCLCVPQWIVRRFGLFDEVHLTWATGEDSDFSLRIRQAGYKIRVVPEAKVAHIKRATMDHVGPSVLGYDPVANELKNRKVLCSRWRHYVSVRDFPPQQILIKRASANGDVLCTEPVIRAVKQLRPNSDISVQTQCPEMLMGGPMIKRVAVSPPSQVDRIIDLDMAYERNPKVHMVAAYAQAAGVDLSLFPPEVRRPRWHLNPQGYEAADALPTDRPIAVIATEGSWPIRQWPKDRFAAVVRWLQRYCRVIEVGSPAAALNMGWNLCGKTTIQQLAAIYSRARLAVMCDSLHVHLAACFSVPTVGIWGGTDPMLRIHGPEHHPVQRLDFPCRGCHHEREVLRCHSVCDQGAFRGLQVPKCGCMDIPAVDVIRAIEQVLDSVER